jgi:hypothetical protein
MDALKAMDLSKATMTLNVTEDVAVSATLI